jgi:hypothetical protein
MASKTRVANKTLWALEDLAAATAVAWDAWRICQERAKKLMDPLLLASLGDVSEQLGRIERKVRMARAGEYQAD